MTDPIDRLAYLFERDIAADIRHNPFYQVGMRVQLYNGDIYGRVISCRGFSDSSMQHLYDLLLDDGNLKFNIFESDLMRVTGAVLRRIK